MKNQKLVIAVVVAAAFVLLLDYVWYMVLMKDFFSPMPSARAEIDFMWLTIGIVIYALAFVYLYTRFADQNETKVHQGVNFGVWITLLVWASMTFIYYGLLDAVLNEYLVDLAYRLVQSILLGLIVAHLTGIPGGGRGKGAGGGDA